ncbi:hypothetical protein JTE90_011000 [Oedothorax gibbosus]|uniref:Uncharacterized protein n=1 Tax=Oedothorax gibbosus TaxID=931172 RepID=A0AAV6VF96_9ARAC|nr:hypothetical protein JTE90_011000 [Oedothorax gibbosus]
MQEDRKRKASVRGPKKTFLRNLPAGGRGPDIPEIDRAREPIKRKRVGLECRPEAPPIYTQRLQERLLGMGTQCEQKCSPCPYVNETELLIALPPFFCNACVQLRWSGLL